MDAEAILYPFLVFCAVTDAAKRKIYNVVTFPLFFAGLLYSFFYGDFRSSLLGAAAAFAICYTAFALGGTGGGDGKLATALGAWIGLVPFLNSLFNACLIGIVWGLTLLYRQNRLREKFAAWKNSLFTFFHSGLFGWVKHLASLEKLPEDGPVPAHAVPFGTCLVIGFFLQEIGLRFFVM